MRAAATEPVEAGHLLPVRMLNEYTYCPRLMYLEWVQGEWAESADTHTQSKLRSSVGHEGLPCGVAGCWKPVLGVHTTLQCLPCLGLCCRETSPPASAIGMKM